MHNFLTGLDNHTSAANDAGTSLYKIRPCFRVALSSQGAQQTYLYTEPALGGYAVLGACGNEAQPGLLGLKCLQWLLLEEPGRKEPVPYSRGLHKCNGGRWLETWRQRAIALLS